MTVLLSMIAGPTAIGVGVIYAIRSLASRGNLFEMSFYGFLSLVALAWGLIMLYSTIYKEAA